MKFNKKLSELSHLEAFILRTDNQRETLERLYKLCEGRIYGTILEVGLGSGRTYDHIRKQYPDNRVIAFDYSIDTRPEVAPPAENTILGEIKDTLPEFIKNNLGSVGFVHLDIGSKKFDEAKENYYISIGSLLDQVTTSRAWIASDRILTIKGWSTIDLSDVTSEWPYYLIRKDT